MDFNEAGGTSSAVVTKGLVFNRAGGRGKNGCYVQGFVFNKAGS